MNEKKIINERNVVKNNFSLDVWLHSIDTTYKMDNSLALLSQEAFDKGCKRSDIIQIIKNTNYENSPNKAEALKSLLLKHV
jgi:hypothetical protein